MSDTAFHDFFGREIHIGDYCAFVGAEMGKIAIVKVVSLSERIGIRSYRDCWRTPEIGKPGFTPYGHRLIIANDLVKDEIKQVFKKNGA